ncbi:hypothetical protein B0O80DRAFT_466229 [Mortierella sp. GBAus27b]|nr:hypothetical protein B0O80DRAFT_466229 [Mortierella sp. GBAus27b]
MYTSALLLNAISKTHRLLIPLFSSSSRVYTMNYLHFDSDHLFFLIKAVPMESTPGLLLGLALTSGMCVCERVLTSRLESISMALYERQHQKRTGRKDASSGAVAESSMTFSPARNRRLFSSGDKDSVQGLLFQKTVSYGVVNVLRLGYMLLAMSLNIWILLAIISSLTCTQLCLDMASLSRTRENAWSEYEQIGSTRTEAVDDDAGGHRGHGLFDVHDEQEDDSLIAMQSHAISRSHDCA